MLTLLLSVSLLSTLGICLSDLLIYILFSRVSMYCIATLQFSTLTPRLAARRVYPADLSLTLAILRFLVRFALNSAHHLATECRIGKSLIFSPGYPASV